MLEKAGELHGFVNVCSQDGKIMFFDKGTKNFYFYFCFYFYLFLFFLLRAFLLVWGTYGTLNFFS